jgi:diaminopimelate epimerase
VSKTVGVLTITKHHGLANDFLVLLDTHGAYSLTLDEGAELARMVCNRHTGIGADGLLLALPAPEDGSADVTMRLHNADGSIAEMSGNGIRCFAQAVVDSEFLPGGTLRVATDAGLRVVEVHPSDADGVAQIRVGMGTAIFDSIEVSDAAKTVIGDRRFRTVDVGNPHIVIEADPATIDLATAGPEIEQHFMAAHRGINVEFVGAAGPDQLDMIVWERGVGITQACGTGATATALVANGWGLSGASTEVRQPGGSATVEWDGTSATLIGPSKFIARCVVPLPTMLERLRNVGQAR